MVLDGVSCLYWEVLIFSKFQLWPRGKKRFVISKMSLDKMTRQIGIGLVV